MRKEVVSSCVEELSRKTLGTWGRKPFLYRGTIPEDFGNMRKEVVSSCVEELSWNTLGI
jgi:hypothetical protein